MDSGRTELALSLFGEYGKNRIGTIMIDVENVRNRSTRKAMSKTATRFRVIDEEFGESRSCRLIDTATNTSAEILPFLGGAVNSLIINQAGTLLELIDGYRSLGEAVSEVASSFKGSSLFPFPNRVENGKYSYDGEPYQLRLNFPQENNAIHGLVYNKEFTVQQRVENNDECSLDIGFTSSGPDEGYPFPYHLMHRYCLHKSRGFSCTTRVTNRFGRTIPIGHGFHPYFSAGADRIDNLVLQFPAEQILAVDSRNIPTGARTAYKDFTAPSKIGTTTLDSCFCLSSQDGRAETSMTNPQHNLRLTVWQETGPGKYNYLQLYTPPHRKSIAIEPMSCPPNALNSSEGLIHLYAGKTVSFSWGVETA